MAGLLGYAAAGALAGFGAGIVDQARQARDDMLRAVQEGGKSGGAKSGGGQTSSVKTFEHFRNIAWDEAGSPTDESGNPLFSTEVNNRARELARSRASRPAEAKPTAAPARRDAPPSVMSEGPVQSQTGAGLPSPASEAEYNKLPSGTRYLDPNGIVRRKP